MARPPCRKLTLADIMILIGATAGGLALTRPVLASDPGPWWSVYPMCGGSSVLAAWTVAHFALRLRGPRPTLRRLYRQPGAAASLAGLVVIAAWSLTLLGVYFTSQVGRALDLVPYTSLLVGPSVAGTWLPPLATRSLLPERGWIDRSGIALGGAWIALMLIVFAGFIVED